MTEHSGMYTLAYYRTKAEHNTANYDRTLRNVHFNVL